MPEHKKFAHAPEGSSDEVAGAVASLEAEAESAEARLRRLLERDAAAALLDAQPPADA